MIQEKMESCHDTVANLLVFHPAKEGKKQKNPNTNNYQLQNVTSRHTEHIQNKQKACCYKDET